MPLVNVKIMEGVFSPLQKREMIHKLTEAMIEVEGENMRPVTLVIIDEIQSGDWAVGGHAFTSEAVKDLAHGRVEQLI